MRRSVRRLRSIAVSVAILVLVVAAAVWVGTVAIERWLGQELRALATARLNPIFAFDDLSYAIPSTITLSGLRLTSPDPKAPSKAIEILAIDSLSLVLSNVPWPNGPFRVRRLDLAVDGGPLQRLENEFGAAGDVLGELIETFLRARVSGTLGEPKVDIEVLRHSLRR